MNTDKTFSQAVDDYLAQATYLSEDDLPAIVALKKAAAVLDAEGVQAALLNTFGITYRSLLKRNGGESGPVDEGEAFLNSL